MKHLMLAILFATTVAVGGSSTTQAFHDASDSYTLAVANNTVREQPSEPANEQTDEQKRLELEAKKQELEQKVAAKRDAITEKLLGVRAERCEAKQDKINMMLDNRIAAAQKHLDTFSAIEIRLIALVEEKNIDVESNAAQRVIMTDLQEDAQVAIDSLNNQQFDCEKADPNAPGAIVKDQMSVTKQALKDYRDSIKNYAVAMKTAIEKLAEPTSEETPAEETTETTTENEEEAQQ